MAYAKPGDELEMETLDAYAGIITLERSLAETLARGPLRIRNLVTGPVFVEGAKAGDVLCIEVLDIRLPQEGLTMIKPGSGALEGWLTESPPVTRFTKIENGKALFNLREGRRTAIPVRPFVGIIGVSPALETIATLVPGRHGGNMDSPDVSPGSRLFLPVAVDGALFGLGDVHAVQGEGEACGTALEVESSVKVRLDIVTKKAMSWPRVETPLELVALGSGKPLEDAARSGLLEMLGWLRRDYGYSTDEAYMLLSLAAGMRVTQMVKPLYTKSVKLPKALALGSERGSC